MAAIHMHGGASAGRKTFYLRSQETGRCIEFIPERGMITIRTEAANGRDDHYDRISIRTFLERTVAITNEVKWLLREANKDSGRAHRHRSEALHLQRAVECMIQAAKQAQEQGDPFANMLELRANESLIKYPRYETNIGPVPGPVPGTPMSPTVRGQELSKVLVLPPGTRRLS